MKIEAIAKRLVELCREGKYEQAQRELYAEDCASVEPDGLPPGALGSVKGLKAIYEKTHQFEAMVEAIHANTVSEPVIAGNWFSVAMSLDMTMKGRGRMVMQEIAVYQVHNGKVVLEKFFYDVG
jgi:hypothetical protein